MLGTPPHLPLDQDVTLNSPPGRATFRGEPSGLSKGTWGSGPRVGRRGDRCESVQTGPRTDRSSTVHVIGALVTVEAT